MRYLALAFVFLSACASAPTLVDEPRGIFVQQTKVYSPSPWWKPSRHAFDLGSKWNEKIPDNVILLASVDGYTDIADDGLRLSCESVRVSPKSSDSATHHALDGGASSRAFAIGRDDLARLLACGGFDAVLITERGGVNGRIDVGSPADEGLRMLARRITQLESWRN